MTQVPPTDPGSSNSQDVKFMDGLTDPHHDESILPQVALKEEQSQWPPHTNVMTYELRSVNDGVTHEAPVLAITTRTMRGNIQVEKDVELHEEYPSDEDHHLSDLERVAKTTRKATKDLEKDNGILQDRERPNVIHDLDGSEMGG
jgi:hypothetical protein